MAAYTLSRQTYYFTCGGLLLLTLATWGVAYLPLGPWHPFVALGFATAKAVLIVLFFMHARYSNWLTWVVIISALFWLGILFVLTLGDYLTRNLA